MVLRHAFPAGGKRETSIVRREDTRRQINRQSPRTIDSGSGSCPNSVCRRQRVLVKRMHWRTKEVRRHETDRERRRRPGTGAGNSPRSAHGQVRRGRRHDARRRRAGSKERCTEHNHRDSATTSQERHPIVTTQPRPQLSGTREATFLSHEKWPNLRIIPWWEPRAPLARSMPYQRVEMSRLRFLKVDNRGF